MISDHRRGRRSLVGPILVLTCIGAFFMVRQVGIPKAADRSPTAPKGCRVDLDCWTKFNMTTATVYCRRPIEHLARYQYRWLDGWTVPMFTRSGWRDKKIGSLVYTGDRIELQNAFGVFGRMTYHCVVEPDLSPPSATAWLEDRLLHDD